MPHFIDNFNIYAPGGGALATVAPDVIQLAQINRADITKQWTFLPLGGVTVGDSGETVTIQSAYTGAFVVPGDDNLLRYSLNPYGWSITSAGGIDYFIRSTPPGGSALYWNRSGENMSYGPSQANMTVIPAPAAGLRQQLMRNRDIA